LINKNFFNLKNIKKTLHTKPFKHIVFDGFLNILTLKKLQKEFPDYKSDIWHNYSNYCELKKTCNQWNHFNKATYSFFMYLNSSKFINYLSKIFSENIHADFGLHGAGINIMKGGLGKLNPHLDNNIHPKTKLKRKYNLLFFFT